ncbi:predicted protein [Chaetoceros tenuissimus]|uniref:Uncharacterized protein n=1 Tax=Chaetoceros tenuissimus TaxID=426638 RepID=A0AAD3D6K6_9STRA|nr:predicted protein [Chaetoceros tenuissimus]
MPFTLKASGSLKGNGRKRKCFPAEELQANGAIQCPTDIHIFSSLKSGELQFPDELNSRKVYCNKAEMHEFEPTSVNPSKLPPPPESPISSQIQNSMRGLTLISSPGSSFTPINRTPKKSKPSYSASTGNTPDATERVRSVSLISSSTPNSGKHTTLRIFNEQVISSSTSMSRTEFMPLVLAPRESLGLPKISLSPRNDEDSTLGTPKPGWLISPRFRQNPPSSENSCFVHWDSPPVDEQDRSPKPPVSCVDISEAGRSVSDSYRSLLCHGPNECIDDYEYVFDDVTVEPIDNHSHDDGFFLSDPSTFTQNSGLAKRMKFVKNEESPLSVTNREVSKSIAFPTTTAKSQQINTSSNQGDGKVSEHLSFPSGDNVVSATGKEVDTYLPNFRPDIMCTEKLDQHVEQTIREDMITPPINNQRPTEPPLLKSRQF